MTRHLAEVIFQQRNSMTESDEERTRNPSFDVREMKKVKSEALIDDIKRALSADRWKFIEFSAQKVAGYSTPEKFGFRLSKQQFFDALCPRYNISPCDLPRLCGCGKAFSLNHCLSCKLGGFVHIRHNAVRDTVADILKEVA